MQSKIIFFVWVFISTTLLSCDQAKDSKNQKEVPVRDTLITFEKTNHSFGKVNEGQTVGCYFNFTNSGVYPLVISHVKPGCGCTDVKYPKKPVLPGETGEIEIRFDSGGFSGHQYKVIQIFANIENKMKELVISANVIN